MGNENVTRKARAGASPAPTLLRDERLALQARAYRVRAGLAPALVALVISSFPIPLGLQFFETVADAAFR